MVQLVDIEEPLDSIKVATSLSQELAETAVARDAQAGVPEQEIQRLRKLPHG